MTKRDKNAVIRELKKLIPAGVGLVAVSTQQAVSSCIQAVRTMPEEGECDVNQIPYEERKKVYRNAIIAYGDEMQLIVAVEELAECQQAICKILRGNLDFSHLAEEVADATIMLEQVRLMFNINGDVCAYMDDKIKRLNDRLRGSAT